MRRTTQSCSAIGPITISPVIASMKFGSRLGLPKVEQHNIKELFLQYADDKMDMSASYKPVMLLAILGIALTRRGRPGLRCGRKVRAILEARKEAGLVVEKASAHMAKLGCWTVPRFSE